MNIQFDKTDGTVLVTNVPLEATNVVLNVAEFRKESSPANGKTSMSIGVNLVGSMLAVKETQVENPVFDEGGNQIDVVISTEVTVLESQAIDLKVL